MKPRKYIYVVACGERDEGQFPEAAWTTLAQARADVFSKYDVSVSKRGAGTWRATIDGCDEVWIHRLFLGGTS